MSLTFRAFEPTPVDFELHARLYSAHSPEDAIDAGHVQRTTDAHAAKFEYERVFAYLDGEPVASMHVSKPLWFDSPHMTYHTVSSDPSIWDTKWHEELWNLNEKRAMSKGRSMLLAFSSTLQPYDEAWLREHGYEQTQMNIHVACDLDAFSVADHAPLLDRLSSEGFEILALQELEDVGVDWRRPFYEMELELDQDIPVPEPLLPEPFEEFAERSKNPLRYPLDSLFVARQNGELVGVSMLYPSRVVPERMHTGLTGVRRPYRRKGLARAMKVRAMQWAKEHGKRTVFADNEQDNPMLQLNRSLGFAEFKREYSFQKVILREDLSQSDREPLS
jgi:GNAT superfamily N-acetyltransferase